MDRLSPSLASLLQLQNKSTSERQIQQKLQQGEAGKEIIDCGNRISFDCVELNSAAILETAATISALDLIISADTTGSRRLALLANLAGVPAIARRCVEAGGRADRARIGGDQWSPQRVGEPRLEPVPSHGQPWTSAYTVNEFGKLPRKYKPSSVVLRAETEGPRLRHTFQARRSWPPELELAPRVSRSPTRIMKRALLTNWAKLDATILQIV